ncbi:hypothetical protein C8Q79DRAFT_773569 [Trametes meyenii]|nr:hypothetical protein C8Q79DRAFT_773569 [Trametes meyenii]
MYLNGYSSRGRSASCSTEKSWVIVVYSGPGTRRHAHGEMRFCAWYIRLTRTLSSNLK